MRADREATKLNRSWLKYMKNVSKEKDKIDLWYKLRNARKDERLTIARNLLAEGCSTEFIIKTTGLSLEDIMKL